MIDSGSRSQVRPLESFKRNRFGLLAIAFFSLSEGNVPFLPSWWTMNSSLARN